MRRDTRIIASFLASFSALILGASALCAWAVAHGASPRWRMLFRMMCHGIERRCLTLFGVPMPICARCTAIYVGLIGAAGAFILLRPLLRERAVRIALFVAVTPMLLDGLTQATGMRESTNPIRLVTGFVAAFAFGLWAVTAVESGERAIS